MNGNRRKHSDPDYYLLDESSIGIAKAPPRVENPHQEQLMFSYDQLLDHIKEQYGSEAYFSPSSGPHYTRPIGVGIAIHEALERHFSEAKPVFVLDAEHGSYTIHPYDLEFVGVDMDGYRNIPRTGKSVMSIINGVAKAPPCRSVSVAGRHLYGYGTRDELNDWAFNCEALRSIRYFSHTNWFTRKTGIQPGTNRWREAMQDVIATANAGVFQLKQEGVEALAITDHGTARFYPDHVLQRPRPLHMARHPYDASGSMGQSEVESAIRQIAGLDAYLTHEDTVRVADQEPNPVTGFIKGYDDTSVYVAGDIFHDDAFFGDRHLEIDKED